ncbi:hypothetical protein CVT24_012479 [Panaeolus cyanescens]|uniref:MYND-type domain-containing protein n=1 Tax=Panaeolus cyanescens TaxID=181874 RepID=A0A409X0S4_9AGAR|nr:hypothetical protein CVT24_012479 [Panaeolus cyanescens]
MQRPIDCSVHRCSFCRVPGDNLLRCSGCKAATYCNQQHQADAWSSHKALCKAIQKGLKKLEVEKRKIENNPADSWWPGNLFETSAGHFWGIIDTRDYMRARLHVAWELQKVTSREAVKTSLNHFRDMIRLNRSDNMGVRNTIPGLYVRLKKDQEAYDFLKWYATEGSRSDYDWANLDLPFLNLKDQDAMENLAYFKEKYDLSAVVVMCLIQLRMLLDLQDIKEGTRDPSDLLSLRSGIWKKRPELLRADELEHRISTLQSRVDILFKRATNINKHFWVSLLNYEDNLSILLDYFSSGDASGAIMSVQNAGRPWIETDGVDDFEPLHVAPSQSSDGMYVNPQIEMLQYLSPSSLPDQVDHSPTLGDAAGAAEGTTISVSTAFNIETLIHESPPDIVFSTSDSVLFYGHTGVILARSPHAFQGVLGGGTMSGGSSADTANHIDIPSDEFNIIMHMLYDTSPAAHSPSLQTIIQAIDRTPLLNIDPKIYIVSGTHIFALLESYVPLRPLDIYSFAGHHTLHDLATRCSSQLLSFSLTTLTDAQVERMGAVYLKKLLSLHIYRMEELKKILQKVPEFHAVTDSCKFPDQKALSRAWALAAASLIFDASPGKYQ